MRAWLFASENGVHDLPVVHAVLQRDAVCIAVCCSVLQCGYVCVSVVICE